MNGAVLYVPSVLFLTYAAHILSLKQEKTEKAKKGF